MLFGVLVLLLSVLFWRFIHINKCISGFFLFVVGSHSIERLFHVLFVHSAVSGRVGCFLEPLWPGSKVEETEFAFISICSHVHISAFKPNKNFMNTYLDPFQKMLSVSTKLIFWPTSGSWPEIWKFPLVGVVEKGHSLGKQMQKRWPHSTISVFPFVIYLRTANI